MDEKEKFYSSFESEITELMILTEEHPGGWIDCGDMKKTSIWFCASVDMKTGLLSEDRGLLEWLENTPENRFGLTELGIFHVKARKRTDDRPPCAGNRYLAVEAQLSYDEQLDKIKQRLMEPVYIDAEFGRLVLDRQFSEFRGEVKWLSDGTGLYLETDEERGDTANAALERARGLYKNRKELDKQMREYAAAINTKVVNGWFVELAELEKDSKKPKRIAEKVFEKKLGLMGIDIKKDGSASFTYDPREIDEILDGCAAVIVVEMDKDGNLISADIDC